MTYYKSILDLNQDIHSKIKFTQLPFLTVKEVEVLPKPDLELDQNLLQQAKEYPQLEQQIVLHCSFQHTPFFNPSIRIWKNTYLKPKGSTQVFRMLNAFNISIYPEWTKVKYQGIHEFTLIFEGLPKDCKTFDLIEDIPEDGGFYVPNIRRNSSDIYLVNV